MAYPFMLAYWLTLAIIPVYGFIYYMFDLDDHVEDWSNRAQRNMARVHRTMTVVLIVGVVIGIWVPVFVPGVY